MGSWYDDDDLLLRIKSKNINILNIFHNIHKIGGIHLFHGYSSNEWDNGKERNGPIFFKKKNLLDTTGVYIDVTEDSTTFDEKHKLLL